jgi:hypothetical protein
MGKYNSFEMIQNYDIAIIKKLSYVPLSPEMFLTFFLTKKGQFFMIE